MDNMIFVALMVVSFILINPHLSAAADGKDVAATTEVQSDDDSDEDEEEEEDEEPSN